MYIHIYIKEYYNNSSQNDIKSVKRRNSIPNNAS